MLYLKDLLKKDTENSIEQTCFALVQMVVEAKGEKFEHTFIFSSFRNVSCLESICRTLREYFLTFITIT